jgi:hypothetical protein
MRFAPIANHPSARAAASREVREDIAPPVAT